MAKTLFKNNVAGILAVGVGPSDTSIILGSGQGAAFPAPTGGDWFYATIINADTSALEIVKCTARAGDTLTVVRGQDSTTAISMVANSVIEMRLTTAALDDINWQRVRGIADGLASLEGDGKIPDSQIPASIARDSEVSAGLATKQNLLGFTAVQQGTGTGQDPAIAVKIGAVGGEAGKLHLTLGTTDKGALASEAWVVSRRGVADGIASLDGTVKIPLAQIPALNYLALTGGTVDGNVDVNGTLNVDDAATFANNAKCFSTAAPTTGRMALNSAGDRFVEFDGTVYKFGGAVDVQAQDFVSTSDARLKLNVHDAQFLTADDHKHLKLSEWVWLHAQNTGGRGVIAQETKQHFPWYVKMNADGFLAVDKAGLALEVAASLSLAVQELEKRLAAVE